MARRLATVTGVEWIRPRADQSGWYRERHPFVLEVKGMRLLFLGGNRHEHQECKRIAQHVSEVL